MPVVAFIHKCHYSGLALPLQSLVIIDLSNRCANRQPQKENSGPWGTPNACYGTLFSTLWCKGSEGHRVCLYGLENCHLAKEELVISHSSSYNFSFAAYTSVMWWSMLSLGKGHQHLWVATRCPLHISNFCESSEFLRSVGWQIWSGHFLANAVPKTDFRRKLFG